jgi:sulfur-carrier protein
MTNHSTEQSLEHSMMHSIRVIMPYHLQTLAKIGNEVVIDVQSPVTHDAIVEAIESHYPALRGTIRDHATKKRRPLLRYFVCQKDVSHEPPETLVPEDVLAGTQPFIIWGAVAGG